jgi:predicted deacylase
LIDAHRFFSRGPGPRVLLLGGVHGDEKPGVLALDRLAAEFSSGGLSLARGQLTIVPRANAEAVARGLHFIDENLNRIVRPHDAPASREQGLAAELAALIAAHDAVLDLHGTPAPTVPFAFLDDESVPVRGWAEALGAEFLVLGWPALYAGSDALTTTGFAQTLGKRAVTVEAGQNDDPAAAEFAFDAARRAIAHFGLIIGTPRRPKPKAVRLTAVVRREREGKFERPWKNFDPVKKGEIVARYADGVEIVASEDAFVVMPYEAAAVGEEWYYLAVPVSLPENY